MSLAFVTGVLLILVPIAFNVIFFMLGRSFEYPDILRKPTPYILERFQTGGRRLVGLWYSFAFAALVFAPVAVLLSLVLQGTDTPVLPLATLFGVLAGILQCLGLLRWSFIVPTLARNYLAPNASAATRDSIAVTFETIHQYLGGAVGEHLGYLFTALWSVTIAVVLAQAQVVPPILAWLGILPALGILLGLLEPVGVKASGPVNAIAYLLWSFWVILIGVFLIVR